ncbi:MAG TPA: ABC transporter permease, partial [Vicinamibacterales bacterium]|nr:ABC transporter permease [Vicinamibacterales bacterium]
FLQRFGGDLERAFEARVIAPPMRAATRAGLVCFHLADAIVSGLLERAWTLGVRLAWPRESAALFHRTRRSLFMTRESLNSDLKLALRQFSRTPMFAALTVLTLALGIGATSAIFSVVHAVLLRPLPYADAGRLVMIWSDNTRNGEKHNPVSPANAVAMRQEARSFTGIEYLYSFLVPVQIRTTGEPDLAQAATVSPGIFNLLGRSALVGRTLQPGDQEPAVLLSYAYWQRRFGGDRAIVGQTATVGGIPAPVRIVGVMPDDFVFPYRSMLGTSGFSRALNADVWLAHDPARDTRFNDRSGQPLRNIHYLGMIGRLAEGTTLAAARVELEAIAARREAAFPDTNKGWGVTVKPLHEQAVGAVRPALLMLLVGAGVVLLITCVNVANMLFARSTAQQRDLAIRSALGASRRRLIQQTLVESTTLSLAGGALGLVAMALGTRALLALAPRELPRLSEVSVSPIVLLFGLTASLLTGLLIGSLPAWSASRSRAHDSMRDGTRTTTSVARTRLRSALIVAEVTMATALTIGAALLFRSFVAVMQVDPGFQPSGLLTFQMNMPAHVTDAAARLAYYDDLEARLRALPGVVNVGGTTRLPLGSTNVTTYIAVEGRSNLPAAMPEVEMRRSLFDYVGAMQIPLDRGRAFTREDGPGQPPTVMVNEEFARRVFPGEDPIGRHVAIGGAPAPGQPWLTIIGVIGSIRHGSLEEAPKPEIYTSYRNGPPVAPFVVLRTSVDPATLAASVRDAVRATGADAPYSVLTMETLRADSVSERRFVLLLLGAFGALALSLAAVGVYGVISLLVAERRAEMSIRLALGATPARIGRLMVGRAVVLAIGGVAAGCAIGLAMSPWLESALFGVTAVDPATYVAVAAVLLTVAAGAALVPARRAMMVDPTGALRG